VFRSSCPTPKALQSAERPSVSFTFTTSPVVARRRTWIFPAAGDEFVRGPGQESAIASGSLKMLASSQSTSSKNDSGPGGRGGLARESAMSTSNSHFISAAKPSLKRV
jgi:hypothetical protein